MLYVKPSRIYGKVPSGQWWLIVVTWLPVVPHKAAEISKIGHYRRGALLSCMDGRANPLMDRKEVGVVFFWSGCNCCSGHFHPQLLDVAWCSAVVVVVVV